MIISVHCEFLKPKGGPDVVIHYANRVAPTDAAQLGKLVGETRPTHPSVVFEAKAAAHSILQSSRFSARKNGVAGFWRSDSAIA